MTTKAASQWLRLLKSLRLPRGQRSTSASSSSSTSTTGKSEDQNEQFRKQLADLQAQWESEQLIKQNSSNESAKDEDTNNHKGVPDETKKSLFSSKQAAESVHWDAQKIFQEFSGSSYDNVQKQSDILESVKSVANFVPNFISGLAQQVLPWVDTRQGQDTGEVKEKSANVKLKDGALKKEKKHHWKRHLNPEKPFVTKSMVDARTRSCIDALQIPRFSEHELLLRLESLCSHLHHYPFTKGVAVRHNAIGELLFIQKTSNNDAVLMLTREALSLLGYHGNLPGKGIRILCLDGGGMRGVVALEVLSAIEKQTGKRINELFDFMCGVSTGAIIVSFLSFHKKSISEIEEIYRELGKKVFARDIISGTRGWVMSHSYYDTKIYEDVLKNFVGETKLNETLRSSGTPLAAIVATLVSDHRICPYVFRNYQYPYRIQSFFRGSARYGIWEAVRASSAAPGYFDEYFLDGKIFHDGGIMTNNATNLAIHEAQRVFPNDHIHCVVSLGMGLHERPFSDEPENPEDRTKPKSLSLTQKFSRVVDAATDTELTHAILRDLLPASSYYRFNPFLSEYVPLDDTDPQKMAVLREDTQMYLRRNWLRVQEACDQLTMRRSLASLSMDTLRTTSEITKAKLIPHISS